MSETWWISDSHLDPDQASAVQDQPDEASFLIRGPAGSGKTNILLLRAKWFLFKKKSNFKIIVFNRSLKEFLQDGCEKYGIPKENVVTSIQFLRELLAENYVEHTSEDNFEQERMLLAGQAQSLLAEEKISETYDALLVDECQDYLDTELLIFRRLARRLILASDSRQSIYRASQTSGLLDKLVNNNVIDLKFHYRSGLRICTVADSVLKGSSMHPPISNSSSYDEKHRPSSVTLVDCKSLEEQFSKIITQLASQLDAYPGELIGVLFPKRDQVASFQETLTFSGFLDEENRIRIVTMHAAKGLEFRAVHLGGIETLYRMGPTQKRLIYTSLLRGKTAVSLYFTGNIPGYLDSAISSSQPPATSPSLSDLFIK